MITNKLKVLLRYTKYNSTLAYVLQKIATVKWFDDNLNF